MKFRLSIFACIIVSNILCISAAHAQSFTLAARKSNLNRPPLNTNTALQRIEEVREKHVALIDKLIAKNNQLQERITNNTTISTETRTTIISDLQQEASSLQSARTDATSANTFSDIKAAMLNVRTIMNERATRMRNQRAEFLTRAQERATTFKEKSITMIERMRASLTSIAALNISTTELSELINAHETHITTFDPSSASFTELRTTTKQLRAESQHIIQEIKNAIEVVEHPE